MKNHVDKDSKLNVENIFNVDRLKLSGPLNQENL